jgi:hypothetical protein
MTALREMPTWRRGLDGQMLMGARGKGRLVGGWEEGCRRWWCSEGSKSGTARAAQHFSHRAAGRRIFPGGEWPATVLAVLHCTVRRAAQR